MTMNSSRPWQYSSAIAVDETNFVAADATRQHFTVVAETFYYSMKLRCEQCHTEFWFSANEQQKWYEDWGFWIDSVPKECKSCRKEIRAEHGHRD